MGATGKTLATAVKGVVASWGTEGYLFLGFLTAWILCRAIEEGYVIEGDLQEGRLSIHPSRQMP